MEIKPIETFYNGYRFRSRLEARWAVFFDEAGIKYEYEPEGFDLGDGLFYLPDFYLPDEDTWVEVKGKPLSIEEREKIERFCLAKCSSNSKIKFRLFEGEIPNKLYESKRGANGILCFTYLAPKGFKYAMENLFGTKIELPLQGVLIEAIWESNHSYQKILKALTMARQARVEHGETPRIRS